jgi:HEAT repeat protein
LLKDKEPFVRAKAAEALGNIGNHANEAIPALLEAAQDKDVTVRREAIGSVARIGVKKAVGVPVLIRLLKDQSPEVREGAAQILGDIGPKAREAVPALLQSRKDHSPEVRFRAAMALYKIDGKDNHLLQLRTDKEAFRQYEVFGALGKLGPKARPAFPALMEALREEHLAYHAREALIAIDEERAAKAGVLTIVVPDVAPYLQNPNAPRNKREIRFQSDGFSGGKQNAKSLEAEWLGGLDGTGMSYALRGQVDPSKISKTTISVEDLTDVRIDYTDDYLLVAGVTEKDIDGLIKQLYEPAGKVVWNGSCVSPGGEGFNLTLPVMKLIYLGEKARPAVQKRLNDPAIQNEVVLILGAIGDKSSISALIDAYPEIDRRSKTPLYDNHPLHSKIVFFTYALTYLTGEPIGRSSDGADCHPNNKRLWKEWWRLAEQDFRVTADKLYATWVPAYPALNRRDVERLRKKFAGIEVP